MLTFTRDVNAANAEISAAKDLLMHFGYIMGYTTEINFDSLNMAWKRKVWFSQRDDWETV